MRAHLRACDDCKTFERAMGMRQTDLHMLGPWLAGGAGALGLLGYGTGTAGASMLVAGGAGGAAAAGGIGWAGLPMAVKGLAVAALVATTGTAAVELPKVTHRASPDRSAGAVVASAPASLSPLHDQVREQALADAATARRERRARNAAASAANGRIGSSDGGSVATLADTGSAHVAPITQAPAAPSAGQPSTQAPPATREATAVAKTPEQIAAEDVARIRDRILEAFRDAQALARPGTQSALAAANDLIQSTLGSVRPLLDGILATVGLKLPSGSTTPAASQPSGSTTVTNILAPVKSLLGGLDGVLQSLFGAR
jgi:hypothetical protein